MRELSLNVMDIVQNSVSAGAQQIRIEVDEDKNRDRLVISITDNGKGMSDEQVAHVIDPDVYKRQVPMNLMTGSNKADFVITGQWATKAQKEAARYGTANIVASSKDKTFSYIPELDSSTFSKDADYFHICLNNTIYGTRFTKLPDTGNVPLVADVSSCILSEPIDVSKFGVLYAGAQKNMAPAG